MAQFWPLCGDEWEMTIQLVKSTWEGDNSSVPVFGPMTVAVVA